MHLVRIIYMLEFLLALIAVLFLWSQVGGQDHLDLIPWYAKLLMSVTMALLVVLGTMAATSQERAWNPRTIGYLALGLLLAAGMAVLTYYYHLHENDDDEDDAPGVATMVMKPLQEPPG